MGELSCRNISLLFFSFLNIILLSFKFSVFIYELVFARTRGFLQGVGE